MSVLITLIRLEIYYFFFCNLRGLCLTAFFVILEELEQCHYEVTQDWLTVLIMLIMLANVCNLLVRI